MKKNIDIYQIIGLIGAVIAIISLFLPISKVVLDGQSIYAVHIDYYNGKFLLVALLLAAVLTFHRNGKPLQLCLLALAFLVILYDGFFYNFYGFSILQQGTKIHPSVGFYIGIIGTTVFTIGSLLEFHHLLQGN